MKQQEIQEEILKCQQSPYYFATNYIKVEDYRGNLISFKTPLSEEEFNKMFKDLKNGKHEKSN
jgi:hypothetical protein